MKPRLWPWFLNLRPKHGNILEIFELYEPMNKLLTIILNYVLKPVEAWILWVFFITTFTSTYVFGQQVSHTLSDKQITYSKKKIKELKKGALLVRLLNPKSKKADKTTAADNLDIIKAFRKKFDFCPVYFFYSESSPSVKSRKLDQVNFINNQGKLDKSIHFNGKYFLTAEFQAVDIDKLKKSNLDSNLIQTYRYQMKYYSLVVMSEKFEPMQMPFPYFIRNPKNLSKIRRFEKTIAKLSNKLHRYHYIAVAEDSTGKTIKPNPSKLPVVGWFPFILFESKYDIQELNECG